MKKIRVIIVDDMQLVNEGIASLLANANNIEVVAKAFNGNQCLELLQKNDLDIILLDHQMPSLNGLQTLQEIRKLNSKVKIILLTLMNEKGLLKTYMELGIDGCVLKQNGPSELVFGIQQVYNDGTYFSSSVAKVLAQDKPRIADNFLNTEQLTKSEMQVLALVGQGLSVKEISALRHTSTKTVSRQKQNIMDKLGIHKETKLMRFAIDNGIE